SVLIAKSLGRSLTQSAESDTNRLALRSPPERRGAAADDGRRRGAVGRGRGIDPLDRRIIEALQANGRESFRRIAGELGVSEATVRARYARLSDANVLHVVGVTNPLGLGFEAMAMVGIRTAGSPEPVADEIARWREADYVGV